MIKTLRISFLLAYFPYLTTIDSMPSYNVCHAASMLKQVAKEKGLEIKLIGNDYSRPTNRPGISPDCQTNIRHTSGGPDEKDLIIHNPFEKTKKIS